MVILGRVPIGPESIKIVLVIHYASARCRDPDKLVQEKLESGANWLRMIRSGQSHPAKMQLSGVPVEYIAKVG